VVGSLIRVKVTLHSYLKEFLPEELDGKKEFELQEGMTIAELVQIIGLPESAAAAVNESIERDRGKVLQDGDHVRFLRPGAGG
jgi:sulfur carrier protein ThiS